MAMQDVFTKIYEDNKWAGSQSGSGPGSALHTTAAVREALPGIVSEYGVKVLLDAPCGDYNWMLSLEDLGVDRYIGVDVVAAVIEANQAHVVPGVQFLTADLTADPLPRADLVLCRDCLVHFTEDQIRDAVRNLRDSGTEYLLTTTFFSLTENRPGSTGGEGAGGGTGAVSVEVGR